MKKFNYIVIFIILIIYVQNAGGTEPYRTMTFGFHHALNTNRNLFHNHWKEPHGWGGFIELPFYIGEISAGADMIPYHAKKTTISDVNTILFYAGWGIDLMNLPKFTWYNGASFGNNFMIFEDETRDGFKYESEIALMYSSKLEYQISKNVSVFMSGRYFYLLTHHRIRLFYVCFGTGYSFNTPQWIKDFLE